MDNSFIKEIEAENLKIDNNWLDMHYLISLIVVGLSIFLELLIGWIMFSSGHMSVSLIGYINRYFLLPVALFCIFIFIEFKTKRSLRFNQKQKYYIISISFVLICLTIFTIHSAYVSLYFLFAIPILLTSIYGDYKLTISTGIITLTTMISSELFIDWDENKVSVFVDDFRLGNFLISVSVLVAFISVAIVIIYFEKARKKASFEKEMERAQLQEKLRIDDLTGALNRIAFRESFADLENDSPENKYVFVMLDIDNFKILNDTMGHPVGDKCLISLSKIIYLHCHDGKAFRYGGDEFSLLFKNYKVDKVIDICKEIQHEFSLYITENKINVPITISFGIAEYNSEMSPSLLVSNSDKALYRSKIQKNKISLYSEDSHS